MTLAPWRSPLSRALHRNRSLVYARYLQLATVRPDGRPANRTVVFRGFREGDNRLQFVTDSRSEKISQLHQQPWAEVCWYFPKTREQFRLSGRLGVIDGAEPEPQRQQERQDSWRSLSDNARIQFVWPHPGYARAEAADFAPPLPDPDVPVADFCLLQLEPTWVDHLELRGEPQNRWRYHLENEEWVVQSINP